MTAALDWTNPWTHVNQAWPWDRYKTLPIPTDREAIAGAKRLYKVAMGKPWTGKMKITSGNRYTWIRRGVFYVNPNESGPRGGWREIVHSISHYAHRRLHPGARPHDSKQAYLERRLVEYAVKSGFLEGRHVRPIKEKPKVPIVERRAERARKNLERNERLLRRVEKRVAKYRKAVRYYERKETAPE